MSWASIASNQCVSFNNLQDAVTTGVFTLKNAIPVSLEQITKADADYHVYIDTAYGPYASKASNQLIVKSNLVSAPPPCECYILYNDDNIDISISFYECQNSTVLPECLTCPAASQIYLCIQGGRGTEYTVSYGTNCAGGPVPAFTLTALGTNCTIAGDCI
jgi:hypothetical protein